MLPSSVVALPEMLPGDQCRSKEVWQEGLVCQSPRGCPRNYGKSLFGNTPLEASGNGITRGNTRGFDEHRNLEAEKAEVLLELEFWRHFAGRVLHDSTSHLAKARAYVSKLSNEDRGPVLDSIDFGLAALSLAAADDCAEMLLQTREASPPFNALPNLRRFISDWGQTVGQGFRATLPDPDATLIFLGQWAHLEILLTNVFQNAIKHSNMPDAPVEFVCTTKDHFACFEMTNSAAPVSKTFMNASMKIQVDGRKRFGLYLMEQIVSGYSGYIRYDNLPAEGKLPPRVRVSIRLPMDG
jgi:hypothetical protein